MASYNGDFNRMQEEAMQRLRDMQSRSRTAVNRPREAQPHRQQDQRQSFQREPQQSFQQENRQNTRQEQRQSTQQSAPPNFQPNLDPLKSLFGDMKIDSEKALILLILFILYKNKSDPKLLLALGYLLI